MPSSRTGSAPPQSRRGLRGRRFVGVTAGVAVLAVGASLATLTLGANAAAPSTASVSDVKQFASGIPTYLESGVVPPTNKWFSSLAFDQSTTKASFAYPLALQPTGQGMGLAYPKVSGSENTVFGAYAQQVALNFGRTVSHTIASWDDLSAAVNWKSGGSTIARSRFTQGSPYVFTTLSNGTAMSVQGGAATGSDGFFTVEAGDRTYVVAFDPAKVSGSASGTGVSVTAKSAGALVTVGVVPDGATAETLKDTALNQVTATRVSYAKSGSNFVTRFSLTTSGGDTLFGLLPGQTTAKPGSLGSYATIAGVQVVQKGTSFSWTQPATVPETALNLSGLSGEQKSKLAALVRKDAADVKFINDDTYFGGKDLQRIAELLDVARQLGMTAEADSIQAKLKAELEDWLTLEKNPTAATKFFTYDTSLKGIVGQRASFGSDKEFNDHVFHYGYFLNAAAIYARYDKGFAEKFGPAVNLLAADIASETTTEDFPVNRGFDAYKGHSWASGISPFADGNNQESSAEGVNGWYGLYRWATVTGNARQATHALWLYTREASASLQWWLNFDRTSGVYEGYKHPIVSMVWGGKADYATWFSPDAAAKLGIQLLPMSPGQAYLGVDPARVRTNLQGVSGNGVFDAYMLMYQAYADPSGAQAALDALPDAKIDGALTRSYIQAFLYRLPKPGSHGEIPDAGSGPVDPEPTKSEPSVTASPTVTPGNPESTVAPTDGTTTGPVDPGTPTVVPTDTPTVTPSAPPANAGPARIRVTKKTSSEVGLIWSRVSGATGYKVLRAGIPIAEVRSNKYVNDGLLGGLPYVYSVVAVTSGGQSAPSPEITVVTPK